MDGEEIKWSYYVDLYQIDSQNLGHERVCPKLTVNHIAVCKAMEMRVFLATQVGKKLNL